MRQFIIILFVIIFWSCNKDEVDLALPYEGDGTQIEFYEIKPEEIENFNPTQPIGEDDLEPMPWLFHSEIEFYDWSSHSLYLKGEKLTNNGPGFFVITADQVPVFTGFFYVSFMSYMPQPPIVVVWDRMFRPKDVISFNDFGYSGLDTIRSKFRMEMENSGLLKEGIDINLEKLERINSKTLRYTYKATNHDSEIIYILDPNKMGASRFHYFTNGPSLRKGNASFYAEEFKTTASDKIISSWYYKLKPGRSISRTVTMEGYTSLPTGTVEAHFSFPGSNYLNVGEWKKWDGRIWVGSHTSRGEFELK